MDNNKDKSFVLAICLFVSVGATAFINYFGYVNADRLFSLDNIDLTFSKQALWILLVYSWLNYSALTTGLAISIYSQTQNNFSDLSRRYLAYLIYIVCIINLITFTWKNWMQF